MPDIGSNSTQDSYLQHKDSIFVWGGGLFSRIAMQAMFVMPYIFTSVVPTITVTITLLSIVAIHPDLDFNPCPLISSS